MAKSSIWARQAIGGRIPITNTMPQDEKTAHLLSYFIEDVQYALSHEARLPQDKVTYYAQGLYFQEALIIVWEDRIRDSELDNESESIFIFNHRS
jgi:hypothetical protein